MTPEQIARTICLAIWDHDYTPRDPLHPDARWLQAMKAAEALQGAPVAGTSEWKGFMFVEPVGAPELFAPATDYSRKQCDNCDWPSLPECRKCGYPFAATPATDPAPAVCVWERTAWAKWFPQCDPETSPMFASYCTNIPQKCPLCFKPIKFTEAK